MGTYDDIGGFEFVRLAFETFWTEPVTVDEGTIGVLHVFDEYLPTYSSSRSA